MSDINDQGPQNLAQAEAEALRALEAGAWRVWQAGSGPLPAAYARWCAAEIELATAALRERAEKSEAERDRYKREVMSYEEREAACCPEDVGFEDVIASLRERARKADVALAKEIGERERFCADYQREYVRARKAETECRAREDVQARLIRERNAAEAEVARLRGMMDRAVPYITQTGLGAAIYEAVKREARATPDERAAAGLAPEAHAQPQVLKEHLAYLEAHAAWQAHAAWWLLPNAATNEAAAALRAAVARRDGGQK